MTDDALDRRPARATATLAAVVAAGVALLVGFTAGYGRSTLLAVLGSGLLAAGASAITADSRYRQAGGSVAATAGAALLFGLFVLALGGRTGWVHFVLWLGVALVAVDAAAGLGRDRAWTLSALALENGRNLIVGVVATVLLSMVVFYGVVPAFLGGVLELATITALVGFVSLQVLVLVAALSVPRAVSILDRWLPEDDSRRDTVLDSMESVGLTVGDVPLGYWVVLAFQMLAAFVPQAHQLFGTFFGGVLGPLFASGVLHGLVGLVVLAMAGVYAAGVLQRRTVAWLGATPAQTVAVQAGSLVSVLAAVLVSLAFGSLPNSILVDLLEPVVVDRLTFVGVAPALLAALALALLVVIGLLYVGSSLASFGFVPSGAPGFAVGSALLFLGSLAAAAYGTPAVVVFAGVAGALLTWDVGSHASSVGRQLGQVADTRRGEFVHVTGTAAVLLVAVGVASLARYVVVPATAPARTQSMSGPAVLSLVLVLVAVLAFVVAVHLRDRATGT